MSFQYFYWILEGNKTTFPARSFSFSTNANHAHHIHGSATLSVKHGTCQQSSMGHHFPEAFAWHMGWLTSSKQGCKLTPCNPTVLSNELSSLATPTTNNHNCGRVITTIAHSQISMQLLRERGDNPISVVTSLKQWEQMHDFHSHSPSHVVPKHHTMLGELMLLWAMLQPTLQAAWHHTYTWHEKLDQFPAPESTLSNRLFHANSNSNNLWSSQSQHIHQQLLLHVVATTHCSGQTPRAISARPILQYPGKLSNLQACRLADASTPAQGQHLMENSQ